MDIHSESTSGFQSEIEIQNNLSESIIPTTFELNSHLNSSEILESSYRTILVPNIENFCRMCGNEMEFKDLILIFGPKGFELEIPKKISNFLHIQILQNDGLPQQICLTCIYQLNICQQLVLTCQEADVKLRHIFQVMKTSKETTIELPNSTEDHQILNNVNVEPEGLTDSTHTLEEMKILLKKKEASKKFPEESNGNSFEKEPDVKVIMATVESDSNKSNQKPEMFLCDLCGKNFSHDVNLRTHKRTHLADSLKKKHHCTLCTKSFRSKFFLSEHMNMHKDLCPYSCSDCNKKFHKRTQLRQHKKTHLSDSQKVVCEVCGMKFSRRGNLMQHIKTHGKDRTFICRVCKEEFNTLNLLLSHRKLHTQEDIKNRIVRGEHKKENIHSCETCGKVFFKKSSFIYHVRNHKEQSDDNVKWKCKLCGKLLATRASLNYHTKSQHSNERPWRCQFCPEGFMLKDLLLTHERIHTGEKPYSCSVCNKSFRAPNNLTQHMLMHSEDRNFECMYCGKRFHRKGTLNVHIRTHTGERPFICHLCGRPFTQKNDMLKHIKTHGLEPRYSCDICNLSFNYQKDLYKHNLFNHQGDLDSSVVPVIFTSDNNMFSNITHIITEEGKKILLSNVESSEFS